MTERLYCGHFCKGERAGPTSKKVSVLICFLIFLLLMLTLFTILIGPTSKMVGTMLLFVLDIHIDHIIDTRVYSRLYVEY